MSSQTDRPSGTTHQPPETLSPWQSGFGPRYISLFLLIVFFDRMAPSTLLRGGLIPSVVGACAAGVLAYLLLFLIPARWGLETRLGFTHLCRQTFGTKGARYGIDVVAGLVHLGWFALAITYASFLTLKAFQLIELVPANALEPFPVGRFTLAGGPLWIFTIVVWSLAAMLLGPLLWRIVASILHPYSVFPALIIGGLMLAMAGGLSTYQHVAADQAASASAFITMLQLVFCYASIGGLAAVDWGATTTGARDIRVGGFVAMAVAPAVIVSLALVTIAGALGKEAAAPGPGNAATPIPASDLIGLQGLPPYTPPNAYYHDAVLCRAVGGPLATALIIALGLSLLGPACSSPAQYRTSIARLSTRVPALGWLILGVLAAWPFMLTGKALDLPLMFQTLGAATLPILGATCAEALRNRFKRDPSPPRLRWAGMASWLLGFAAGLLPLSSDPRLARIQPAGLLAFALSFLVYIVCAGRRPLLEVEQTLGIEQAGEESRPA